MLNHLKLWVCLSVVTLLGPVCAQAGQTQEQTADAPPIPTIKYVLASPRAALIGPGRDPNHYRRPLGAAENFPREDDEIKIPAGMRVVFCLSRQTEGVWYPHAFGRLSVSIVLQKHRGRQLPTGPEPSAQPSDANNLWVTIGSDGASDVRRGPSIGRARVGVPVLFERPGVYFLRAIVRTVARPMRLRPDDEPEPRPLPAAVDRDVVYVKVKVVNLPITEIEPDEEPTLEPDAAYIIPMPKDTDDE